MMDLKSWLGDHGLTVREFALEFEVPLKTAQDWVYRGVAPLPPNQLKLDEFMACSPLGHRRREQPHQHGACKLCNEVREFENSIDKSIWKPSKLNN